MTIFSTFLLALFLTVSLVPMFRRLAYILKVVDQPAERKVHQQAMPKTGGLAMALGFAVAMFVWAPKTAFFPFLLAALLVIVVAGFLDDVIEFGARAKFLAQIVAALIVVWGGVRIRSLGFLLADGAVLSEWLAVPLTVFFLVGVTNAINLADGLDGLAGGVSVLIFVVIGCLGSSLGDPFSAITAAAMVGALFGFLRYNTFPATIFMGDAGSQMLGFLAGTMALVISQREAVLSPFLPLLLIGFPLIDTLTVMLERIYRGRSPFVADKNHFHHRLMSFGFYHSESVLAIYALQSLMVGAAFVLRYYSDRVLLVFYLGLAGLIPLSFYLAGRFGLRLRRGRKAQGLELQRRLRELYHLTLLIKFLFRALQASLGLTLLVILLPVVPLPDWLALVAFVLLPLYVGALFFKPEKVASVLRGAIYLLVPTLIYLGELGLARGGGAAPWLNWSMNLLFLAMVVLTLLVLRFTRRVGYRTTPLDFLILVTAILVPAVIPADLFEVSIGLVVVKTIALFFTFEVVLEESRSPNRWLEATVALWLFLIGARRFVGMMIRF